MFYSTGPKVYIVILIVLTNLENRRPPGRHFQPTITFKVEVTIHKPSRRLYKAITLKLLVANLQLGKTNYRGRNSTVDLLIKVACFVQDVNDIFNTKRS
jgi:hypothetical protein